MTLSQLHLDVHAVLRSRRDASSGPISADDLARRVGLVGNATNRKRELRYLIADLRAAGYPILSGNDGYWLSHDPAEIRTHATALIEHGRHEIDAGRALMASASRLGDVASYGAGLGGDGVADALSDVERALANAPVVYAGAAERALAEIRAHLMGARP